MILCVGTTPAAQRVMVFERLVTDEVNRAIRCLDGVAGKSINVAKVLHALGEPVLATGFIGGERGRQIAAELHSRGIAVDFVSVPVETRQCVTVIDQSQGTITELVEESRPVSAPDYQRLLTIIRHRAPRARALVLSGTITPGGPVDFYQQCAESGQDSGTLVVVDAKGPLLMEALKARPGLVKPNHRELESTVGRELGTVPDVIDAMRELQGRGAHRVVVTAGREPFLALEGQSVWRVEPPAIVAVNPIGSGDAFTAGLVWALNRGDELGEACRWAVAAGAANALNLMAGELERKDVERLAAGVHVSRV